jgi:glutaminase
MSGGQFVGFNNAVFLSERENADRNYALAFYMRENKCFPEKINLRECLDFYFQVRLIFYAISILQILIEVFCFP